MDELALLSVAGLVGRSLQQALRASENRGAPCVPI